MLKKLMTVVRSYVNSWIESAEDPAKILNQTVEDMQSQLRKATQDVALAVADERRLEAQVESENKDAQEWERKARVAVENGRDDLARRALLRHQEHSQRAEQLHQSWQHQVRETAKLKDALRRMSDKVEEVKRQKNLLVAQHQRAQTQRRIQSTMSGMSDNSALSTFERMATKIEHNERLALATGEIAEEMSSDPLEKEFMKLEKGDDRVENHLLELKQQMGLLSSGSSTGDMKSLPSPDAEKEGS